MMAGWEQMVAGPYPFPVQLIKIWRGAVLRQK